MAFKFFFFKNKRLPPNERLTFYLKVAFDWALGSSSTPDNSRTVTIFDSWPGKKITSPEAPRAVNLRHTFYNCETWGRINDYNV